MKWPRLGDIVAFPHGLSVVPDVTDDLLLDNGDVTPTIPTTPELEAQDDRWRRLRFDNAIRVWVAVPTYLTCLSLRAGGALDSMLPITAVILGYALSVFGSFTLFFNTRFPRTADYVLGLIDLTAMSIAVYLTGAAASPLYFIYFVPVVIHAFHRDWNLILFSGFGGVVFYGVAIFISISQMSPAVIADLCARVVFMLLTVAVTCLALSVLRREEKRQRLQSSRLRAGSGVGHRLNGACSAKEALAVCPDVAPLIAAAISVEKCVVRIAFGAVNAPGVAVPIATEGETPVGTLFVSVPQKENLSNDDLRFLRFIAHAIALCLRRHGMIDELTRSVEMGTAVAAIYLAADRSPRAAQTSFMEGGMGLMHADGATLFLWNKSRGTLDATAWCGSRPSEKSQSFRTGEGIVGEAFARGETRTQAGAASFLIVPILSVGGSGLGVLALCRYDGLTFSEEEAGLATAFVCRSAHALAETLRETVLTDHTPRLAA